MKQKIKMLSTQMGVHDGDLHPVAFNEGEEHEIGPDLLSAFVSLGAVSLVDETSSTAESEQKSEGDAPANKAKKAAPENKAKK